jgi:hypothetical protein
MLGVNTLAARYEAISMREVEKKIMNLLEKLTVYKKMEELMKSEVRGSRGFQRDLNRAAMTPKLGR